MKYFTYGKEEKNYLSEKDPVMKGLIGKHGDIQRQVNPNPFSALVSGIISQQISTKAAITVEERLLEKAGKLDSTNLAKLSEGEIQQCGLSFRKAGYIKGIAQAEILGEVDFKGLRHLSDEEVIKSLLKLKGVGRWTAEMMLIFSLERMDVLSLDDLGIRRGIKRAYGLEKLDKDMHSHFKQLYSPYASVASLYLWEESSGKNI